MESDESIDLVDSEAVNAYGSVVAEKERKNPCEHFEEGENVDLLRFYPFINFFNWSLPSLLNRTKNQLKFPPVERILRSKEWSRLLSIQSSK